MSDALDRHNSAPFQALLDYIDQAPGIAITSTQCWKRKGQVTVEFTGGDDE